MATVKEIKATARPRAGKGAARAVRRAGRVPGVIYGNHQPPLNISLDHAELRQRIYTGKFLTSLYDVDLDGTKHRVIPRDYQVDPVRDVPIHVDFMRLGVGATIRVRVPIRVINSDLSPGIKRGGTVNIVTHTLDVRCPADAIPEAFEVDVSGLEINHSRHLSDITLPAHVRPLVLLRLPLALLPLRLAHPAHRGRLRLRHRPLPRQEQEPRRRSKVRAAM